MLRRISAIAVVTTVALTGCETAGTNAIPQTAITPGYVKLNRPVVKQKELPLPGRIMNKDTQKTEVTGCIGAIKGDAVVPPPDAVSTDFKTGRDDRHITNYFSAGFAISMLSAIGIDLSLESKHDVVVEATELFEDYIANLAYYSLSTACNFNRDERIAGYPFVASATGAKKLSVKVIDNSKAGVAVKGEDLTKIVTPVDGANLRLETKGDTIVVQESSGFNGVYFELSFDETRLNMDYITCVMHRDCETRVIRGLRFFAYPVAKAPLEPGFTPIGLVIPKLYVDMDHCRKNPTDGSRCVKQEFLNYDIAQPFIFDLGTDKERAIELVVKENNPQKSNFVLRKVDPRGVTPIEQATAP